MQQKLEELVRFVYIFYLSHVCSVLWVIINQLLISVAIIIFFCITSTSITIISIYYWLCNKSFLCYFVIGMWDFECNKYLQ